MADEITDVRIADHNERLATLAASNTMVAAPVTSNTAHSTGKARAKRRRNPSAPRESARPAAATAGVQTQRRTTAAPTSPSKAANQAKRTTPKPQPTTR